MNRRKYQMIALVVLIGGPLLANALASRLPASPELQPMVLTPPTETADPISLLPAPLQAPPPTRMAAPPQQMALDGATLSTEPMLEPTGLSVAPADPSNPVVSAPAAPPPAPPAATPQALPHLPPSSAAQFREGPRSR